MRRKSLVWLVLVHVLAVMSIQAQVLPSVDIDTAQTQIDQFLRENELLQERIELLVTTNSDLSENVVLWQTWIAGIETVSERLVDRANQLIDILAELASKSVMERAQTALDRYYDLKAILDAKGAELIERQHAAEASIARNTTVGAELKKKIESNLENIELLKAAIERSAGSEETVNAYIESLEDAIEAAEGALRLLF